MSDLAAAARILTALAQAVEFADGWILPACVEDLYRAAEHLADAEGDDSSPHVAAALLDAARREVTPEVDRNTRLSELEALEANWDSYGALPPQHGVVDRARALTAALATAPLIAPTPKGGVSLEWDSGLVILGIEPDGTPPGTRAVACTSSSRSATWSTAASTTPHRPGAAGRLGFCRCTTR